MADLLFLLLLLLFLIALDRKSEGKPGFFHICLIFLALYLGTSVLNMIIN